MVRGLSKVGLLVVLSFALGSSASAQARGGFATRGTGSMTRAPSVPSRGLVAPSRPIRGTAPGVFRPGFFTHPIVGTPLNPNFAPIRGVPGLGFDFQHLASIERPLRRRPGFRRE